MTWGAIFAPEPGNSCDQCVPENAKRDVLPTKTELQAMIEVQSKAAQQMERIANSLNTLAEGQKEITKALTNGMVEKIVTTLQEKSKSCADSITQMAKDISWLKIILGSATFIALIASLVMHFLKGTP